MPPKNSSRYTTRTIHPHNSLIKNKTWGLSKKFHICAIWFTVLIKPVAPGFSGSHHVPSHVSDIALKVCRPGLINQEVAFPVYYYSSDVSHALCSALIALMCAGVIALLWKNTLGLLNATAANRLVNSGFITQFSISCPDEKKSLHRRFFLLVIFNTPQTEGKRKYDEKGKFWFCENENKFIFSISVIAQYFLESTGGSRSFILLGINPEAALK